MLRDWPCPLPSGAISNELMLSFDEGRQRTVLMIPPLFDEHNKFRRQIVEIMRRLDLSGIDSVLPDLPGWNESLLPLSGQTLDGWRRAMRAAVQICEATHIVTFRSGVLLAPDDRPGWRYAPQTGAKQLRGMIRARTIVAREDGREESSDTICETGRANGIELSGWPIGPELFTELEADDAPTGTHLTEITQAEIGGPGLWLRAEPDEDPEQADAIAGIITIELSEP